MTQRSTQHTIHTLFTHHIHGEPPKDFEAKQLCSCLALPREVVRSDAALVGTSTDVGSPFSCGTWVTCPRAWALLLLDLCFVFYVFWPYQKTFGDLLKAFARLLEGQSFFNVLQLLFCWGSDRWLEVFGEDGRRI